MSEYTHRFNRLASSLHADLRTFSDAFGTLLVDTFHYLALFALGATTVWSAVGAFLGMVHRGRADLGDLLLLFIYLEIGAMVGIYFKTTRLPVRYLIYIAITALARVLIELVSAEHRTGMDILIVSGAILLLSFAVLVLRFGSNRFPSNGSLADMKSGKRPVRRVPAPIRSRQDEV
ncbi:MAG TPA: phosphate-starvation-inducible PsiE family protein [Pseudolabrys sp.]|nr:phosphate-starvation-inducible PsiE family protein [Pseudolabrys sp.]